MGRRWLKARKRLVRLVLPPLRLFSPRLATRAIAAIGRAEHVLVAGRRAEYDGAIRRWSHHFGCEWNVSQLGRDLAGNEVRWYSRDQVLDGLSDRKLDQLVRVTGKEHLDAALAEGKGAVLLGNHFGSHMLAPHWLLRRGYSVRLYMEQPHNVSRFLRRHMTSEGPLGQAKLFISRKATKAESAGSVMRAIKVLQEGMILFIAGDVRWSGPHTAPAEFLGKTHDFTATWVALASLTGTPVVATFARMARDGSLDLEFHPAFHVPADAVQSGQASKYVQACLDGISEQLRRDPANGNEYVSWEPVRS